jgi:hypothetical protein
MNDTPQTDALEKTAMFATRPKDPICGEALLHARKMERERNDLLKMLRELSDLGERIWDGKLVGKPIRNDAIRLLRKYPMENAYANEQRKAADHERMNAEETVARLRARVDDLLKHGHDACEYTDGWDDALLKVRDEFPPENVKVSDRPL